MEAGGETKWCVHVYTWKEVVSNCIHLLDHSEQGMALRRDLSAPVRNCQGSPPVPRSNQHRKMLTTVRAAVHRNCANADTESVASTRRGMLLSIAAATGLLTGQAAGNHVLVAI